MMFNCLCMVFSLSFFPCFELQGAMLLPLKSTIRVLFLRVMGYPKATKAQPYIPSHVVPREHPQQNLMDKPCYLYGGPCPIYTTHLCGSFIISCILEIWLGELSCILQGSFSKHVSFFHVQHNHNQLHHMSSGRWGNKSPSRQRTSLPFVSKHRMLPTASSNIFCFLVR